jgi:hypothetical protein
MDTFSIRGAWSFGFRFFAHRRALQILVLVGIGIAVPLLLQLALFGRMLGMNPSLAGRGEAAAGVMPVIVVMLSYVLQLASYFISWRLGFSPGRPAGGAILYGFLASLLAFAAFALVGTPAFLAAGAAFASGVPILGLLVVLIPLALVFSIFYTLPAAAFGTIAAIVLILSMTLSAVTGNVGMAATLVGGGSGAVVVLYLVLSVALVWLATRFSCTTSLMADWKSYNVFAAMRESWRLTLEDQWAILRYIVLIAFILVAIVFGIAALAGIGAAAFLQGNAGPVGQVAALALGLAFGIPLAFLTVLLPAGIYRELTRSTLAAEVFA